MKQFRRFLAVLLAAMMLASCLPIAIAADGDEEIVAPAEPEFYDVDITNVEKQVMDGLGGAIAFNKAYPLRMWSESNPELAQELMDLMFDEETGIGMDIVRIIVGSGGIINPDTGAEWGNRWYDGPSDTIWPEEGEENIVWNQPNWEEKKASFDADQIWFCQLAQEYGVHQIYATAWTPPYWMKTNKSVQGPNNALLRDDCYDDYAKYLMEFALGYYREFGIHITHISATNECEASHGSYDGFIFNGTNYTKFVKENYIPAYEEYAPKFAELGIEPPLICGPEGTNLGVSAGSQYSGMMQDEEVLDFMDVFTTHLYGSANMFENGPQNAPANNWPTWLNNYTLWQTEYMTQNNGDSSANANTQVYKNQTITDACYWANLITNCFTSNPGFSGYLWWWPWGNNGCDGSDLIRAVHNGAGQGDGDTATAMGLYRIFKRFYAFGNFARFVNDGDIRVDATRVPVSGINLSAYKDPTTGDFKIVVVNNSATDRALSFNFAEDFPLTAEAAVAYRTSASENMALVDEAFAIEDGSFKAEVPAYTVITFVADKGEDNLPGLDFRRDIWSTLEAEDNDGIEGAVETETGLVGANGGYVEFDRINFADGSANGGIVKRHILSLTAIAAGIDGGIIEAHVGSVDGPVVAKIGVPAGDGTVYGSYKAQVNTGDLSAYGIKDLFLTFSGFGEELFAIDRFEFGEDYIEIDNILANGEFEISKTEEGGCWGPTVTVSASTDNWVSFTGATLASVTEENYNAPTVPTSGTAAYSMKVSDRHPASGVCTSVSELSTGCRYSFTGFFMPGEAKNADFVIGTDAETVAHVELLVNKGGKNVRTITIAERADLSTLKWNEISGSFVFDLEDYQYDDVYLCIYDESGNPFYLDHVSLVEDPDKAELIELLATDISELGLSQSNIAAFADAKAIGAAIVNDPTAKFAAVEEVVAALKSALANEPHDYVTLSVEGDIGINFYLDLDTYGEATKVEVTYSDPNKQVTTEKTDVYTDFAELKTEDGFYKFVASAAAPQMTENITVIIYGENGKILYSNTTSVRDILESYIEVYANYAELVDLCENMLTYGGYAQLYFNYKADDLANANYSVDLSGISAETIADYATSAVDFDAGDGLNYKAMTFSCRTNTVMRYAFTAPAGADAADYTAEFVSGGEGMEISITKSGSQLVVNVSDIAAAKLDNEYVIGIYYGETEVYELASYPMSYVKAVLKNESASAELVDLAKAIYSYNAAANVYFGD